MPAINAQVVRDRRAALGISQAALATQVGLSDKAAVEIETGRKDPSTEMTYRLARALGLPPTTLASGLIDDPARAQTIRERRQVAGIMPREMAGTIGISTQHLRNVESGIKNPGPALRAALAAELGCDPGDLAELVAA
jgi:putative transcriptional regulator